MATTVGSQQSLELRLLVEADGGDPVAVELEAPANATVGAVAEALAHASGSAATELELARTGDRLPPETQLADAGLVHGDRVRLDGGRQRARAPDVTGAAELVVVGGPDAGRTFALAQGDHVVGRGDAATLALADPALSAQHVRLTVHPGGRVTATDLRSRNGTTIEGESVAPDEARELPPGALLRAGRTLLAVQPTVAAPAPPNENAAGDGTVSFNRPPRVQRALEPAARPFPAPPDSPQRGRLPLGASLVPLALGIGLYLATHIPTMLFFATLSPVMALSTYLEDRRSGRKGFERRRREYREQLAALRDELEDERRRELALRRDAAPSAPELLRRARTRDPALWERRAGDPDFLSLRIGSADRPALLSVKLDRGGERSLRDEVEEVAAWYATAPAVPVTMQLGELGVAGLCGDGERVDSLARWLVAQAVALHSPRELVVAAALSEDRLPAWNWLIWTPHTRAGSPLGRTLASGPLAARQLLEDLARVLEERRDTAAEAFGGGRRLGWSSILLVLDEAVAPERAFVADLLRDAAAAGVAVLWLGRERRDLPGECRGVVEVDHSAARLSFTDTQTGETFEDVSADGLAADLAEELALALAPVRDTSATRAGAGVPERVALFELLDAGPEALIPARWERRDGERVAAVLGAGAQGPFEVDLRRDGPHALVAGMTGAGKSELLQTLIASLAVGHPPSRLTFLLIDYKGGAAFKDCVELPHTVGVVTDLDAHLTQRALVSLNAELQRRERLLRDAGAKDLVDMERRAPDAAPPSLVIVIDEFATLAKEVPEFIDGVVDVAQRGRSLGVHLVLATQRPGGVVSENIRANTNLRIALRVNEPAESSDVIGVPEAARIPRDRPGRAYARTGHGELTEFQTAYVGGVSVQRRADRSIRVRALGFDTVPRIDPGGGRDADDDTDLHRLVDAASAAAAERRLARPASPWLPPLEPVIALERLAAAEEPAQRATVGMVDDPARQRQEPFVVDLEAEGSMLVYGTSGAGKTTFLRTLAFSLARSASPEELNVYALDFATRGLTALAGLPHCGSVITAEDEERTARLFGFLRTTLERRKSLFAERGVFTLSELRRIAPDAKLPRLLVLLDGYAGFSAAFERVNLGELVDALPRLVGEGRPLGVHFAITADRRGAVPNSLAGIIPLKVVLRMADEDEYASLGVPLRSVRGALLPPGRGFLPGGLEVQTALLGGDPSGEAQAAAANELAQQLRTRFPAARAAAIEPLPTRVERADLPAAEPLQVPLGIGDVELAPASISLVDRHFLVVGPYRSGRSTALATIAEALHAGTPGLSLHLLAPRRSPLASLGVWTSVAEGVEACEAQANAVAERIDHSERAVVVVDDAEELAESPAAPSLETLVRRGRDRELRVVCACERQAAQRAFAGWLRELRKEEHGLLLSPDPDVDGDLLGVRLPRRTNPVYPPGRGYLVRRGDVELVQVAS